VTEGMASLTLSRPATAFYALELFLTHRHHPERVTESRCSYGVTLSWSIYMQNLAHLTVDCLWRDNLAR
jgi:hypothetical protein